MSRPTVTLMIRASYGSSYSKIFATRIEAHRAIIDFVNQGIDPDGTISDVDAAIEFLTLHDNYVRIIEFYPRDDR